MNIGDTLLTPSGKSGVIVGFPRLGRPRSNGARRVQLHVTCATLGRDPIVIRAAYDPRDLRLAEAMEAGNG
jgi:hypothetical protein